MNTTHDQTREEIDRRTVSEPNTDRVPRMRPDGMSRTFRGLQGTDAHETQARIVRDVDTAPGRPETKTLIARRGAYHGLTCVSASLPGVLRSHAGFELPLPAALHVFAPDASHRAEPVMGVGGVHPSPKGCREAIFPVRETHDVQLIANGVATGFGRMGFEARLARARRDEGHIVRPLPDGDMLGFSPPRILDAIVTEELCAS